LSPGQPQPCCAIVLNCNGRELLRPCLQSLAKQRYQEFETVVVDNGSTDGSLAMLAQDFPRVRVIALKENRGFSIANNIAIRDALRRGFEYILLLNNDTVLDAPCIGELLAAIGAAGRIAAVCPKIYFVAAPDRLWYAGADFSLWTARLTQRGWRKKDTGQFDGNLDITAATGCCVLLRASALRGAGLLDEELWAYLEDVEWSIRLRRCGYALRLAPKAQIRHHDGATWVRQLGGGSQARRQYYSTRNMLLIGWRHARWWQLPTYIAGFVIWELSFYTALRILQRDWRALAATYRGTLAGLTGGWRGHGGRQLGRSRMKADALVIDERIHQ
jgi:GT2 family glycosyltransferase